VSAPLPPRLQARGHGPSQAHGPRGHAQLGLRAGGAEHHSLPLAQPAEGRCSRHPAHLCEALIIALLVLLDEARERIPGQRGHPRLVLRAPRPLRVLVAEEHKVDAARDPHGHLGAGGHACRWTQGALWSLACITAAAARQVVWCARVRCGYTWQPEMRHNPAPRRESLSSGAAAGIMGRVLVCGTSVDGPAEQAGTQGTCSSTSRTEACGILGKGLASPSWAWPRVRGRRHTQAEQPGSASSHPLRQSWPSLLTLQGFAQ